MVKKVFIRTFGCQMNEYDSDKMADVLAGSEGTVKTDTLGLVSRVWILTPTEIDAAQR